MSAKQQNAGLRDAARKIVFICTGAGDAFLGIEDDVVPFRQHQVALGHQHERHPGR